jgi:DNA-binding NarL/FixJ family response regulator
VQHHEATIVHELINVKIVFLNEGSKESYIFRSVQAGIYNFLLKLSLLDVIRSVLSIHHENIKVNIKVNLPKMTTLKFYQITLESSL